MLNIEINKKEISISKNYTILQAVEKSGIKIPRFCFHEKLSIAGNCRMCLIEVEKIGKPVASCTLNVTDNLQIYTNTILVKKARESILELLLINHPLDCPICDQGGECDLQDQAFLFGNDKSRFYEIKRSVNDKNISPIIKTIMTRCIHCTRCIRFLNEITGDFNLGVTGRGNTMEIGTYIKNSLNSELSANIIDLCPVGALTSKSYSFVARSWELRNYETIDILDSLGSNIIIQTRGTNILRILPKINEYLNEEWITDKIRFCLDGILIQRLNSPMYQIKLNFIFKLKSIKLFEKLNLKNNLFKIICSWNLLFKIFKEQLFFFYSNLSKFIIIGNQVNLESINLLKLLFNKFNFNFIFNQYSSNNLINIDFQKNYYINVLPKDLENLNVCLLIGVNLRLENPLLNSRLRKSYLKYNTIISSVGPHINSIYSLKQLGNSMKKVISILNGKNKFNINFTKNINSIILIGNYINNLYIKFDYLISLIKNYNSLFKIVNVFPYIASLSLFEYGISNFNYHKITNKTLLYLIQTDEIIIKKNLYNNFVIYQGSHLDKNVYNADLIFPANCFFEEQSTFLNILGVKEINNKIINLLSFVNFDNRNSFEILLNLLHYLDINRINNINYRLFEKIDINILLNNLFENKYFKLKYYNIIMNNFITNYYKTDNITRASLIMSKIIKNLNKNYLNLNF